MSSRFDRTPGSFRLPSGTRWMVLAWLAAETIVFLLLVHAIGVGSTLLLGVATTVLGFMLLRRIGLDAARSLRGALVQGQAPPDALLDGLLSAGGALLLIIPGFIANAVGLALAAPSTRRAVMVRFAGRAPVVARPARPGVIDLQPDDWRPVDGR